MGVYEDKSEQLKVLNEAIHTIITGGQSYKIGTRSLTRADLSTLIAERDRIEAQIKNENCSLLDNAYAANFGYDNRR